MACSTQCWQAATLVPLGDELRTRAVDIVGTGGDRSHSINVSTMAAIVVAGAGVPVCKHGARAASSQCGAADVLEELGVAIELSPEGVLRCIREAGIGFCLAAQVSTLPSASPRRAAREIGIATVFNLLGPMANPGGCAGSSSASPTRQSPSACWPRCASTARSRPGWCTADGLDELDHTGPSTVLALDDDSVRIVHRRSGRLGFAPAITDELVGGEPESTPRSCPPRADGEHGPHRNIVVLNAARPWSWPTPPSRWKKVIERAAASIDSGAAAAALDALVRESQAA